jgi:hypothetical protein
MSGLFVAAAAIMILSFVSTVANSKLQAGVRVLTALITLFIAGVLVLGAIAL